MNPQNPSEVLQAALLRTARLIMRGEVFVPEHHRTASARKSMIGQSGIAVRNIKRADAGQRRGAGEVRRRHRARGHGTGGPAGALHATDLSGRQGLRHRRHDVCASRRQLDAACGGGDCCSPAMWWCSATSSDNADGMFGDLLGHLVSRPRRRADW